MAKKGNSFEVWYKPNPVFAFKVEAGSMGEMFETLGPIQEVMDSCKCGKCGGTQIRFITRDADGHPVYELACYTPKGKGYCGAKLHLGNSDGNLFPRRYPIAKDSKTGEWSHEVDADGKKVFFPDNGWVRWDREQGKYV